MPISLYQHPKYKALSEDWIKWRDLYDGNHKILTSDFRYLWPLSIESLGTPESSKLRKGRELRTRYFNQNEIIVSIWTSIFFQKRYTLDKKTSEMLEAANNAEDNIDGYGSNLETFIKDKIARNVFNYGRAYVLADSFPQRGSSRGQEKALGLRAFLEVIDPLAVVDWQLETKEPSRLGQFRWLRHEYDMFDDRTWYAPFSRIRYSNVLCIQDGRYVIRRYRTQITDEGVPLLVKDEHTKELVPQVEELDPVETDLPEIPLAVYETDSWVKDVSEETLRGFNLRSVKDQAEFDAGYRTIFLIGDGIQDRTEAIATSVWPILPTGSQVFPVEPIDTSRLQSSIDNSIELAFKLGLNQLRSIASSSKESQAADTISAEKENTTSLVESSLSEIESLVNKSLRNFAAVMGKPDFEPKLQLNREVSEQSFDQWSRIFLVFSDLFKRTGGEALEKAISKKAIKKLGLDPEDEAIVLDVINNSKSLKQDTGAATNDPVAVAMNG